MTFLRPTMSSPTRLMAILTGVLFALLSTPVSAQTVFDESGYPDSVKHLAKLTEQRCSSCHSMKRILRADFDAEDWAWSVEDMAMKEKSGIPEKEIPELTRFLVAWSTGKDPVSRPKTPEPPKPTNQQAVIAQALGDSETSPKNQLTPSIHPAIVGDQPLSLVAAAPLPLSGPKSLMLGTESIQIRSVEHIAQKSTTVALSHNGKDLTLSLAASADDTLVATRSTVRKWNIGPHAFELILCLNPSESLEPPNLIAAVRRIRNRPSSRSSRR